MPNRLFPPAFFDAVGWGFGNYANFNGRAGRRPFWYLMLFLFALGMSLELIAWGIGSLWTASPLGVLVFAVSWALLPPAAAAAARRLHDSNRSAWHLLWGLPMLVASWPDDVRGGFWLTVMRLSALAALYLVYLLTRPSDLGPNQYGTAPLAAFD